MRLGLFATACASLIAAGTLLGGSALPAAAAAEACPNAAFRQGPSANLPDCRAYEQVTPVDKDGTNPAGLDSLMQVSGDGERIAFLVPANMSGAGGSSNVPMFLATRNLGAWTSKGLLPPSDPGVTDTVLGSSEDLSQTALQAQLPADSTPALYLRDSATGSFRQVFSGLGRESAYLAGFSADGSHLIFESLEQLVPEAAPGFVPNLYELDLSTGELKLTGVLPEAEGGAAPPGGSVAGPGGPALGPFTSGGATTGYYTQNAISEDGARVFFSDVGTGRIYVREADASRTIAVSSGQAFWRSATSNGRYVFYTEGEQLFRFDVNSETREAITTGSAGVQGVVGTSADGSRLYFVANDVLAGGASIGACNGFSNDGATCNLYVWDELKPAAERIDFVASQRTTQNESGSDANNWLPGRGQAAKSSRVTPDGKTLLFISQQRLTSYDNAGFNELYRFDATRPASSANPACVSCNPTGAPPTASPTLLAGVPTTKLPPPYPGVSRNLTDDGSRVFFETSEALVPQDTNEVRDVYEWEQEGPECQRSSETFSEGSGGCLYLISTGRSGDASSFAGASANGDNVFFFTSQSLTSQDQDHLLDIYDARVGGGIASQNPSPVPICQGESCKPQPEAAPSSLTPGSSNFAGPSNPKPKHHHKQKHHKRHKHHQKGNHGTRKHKKPSGHHNGRKH